MQRIEAAIQRELFKWWRNDIAPLYPDVKFIAVQNENSRFDTSMGVDNGHPDIYLLAPWGILYLELKKLKGRLSEDQKEWNSWFDEYIQKSIQSELTGGYATRAVAYGFVQAKEIIVAWLPQRSK